MAKIFMVEDNPTMVAAISTELNKWQHQVATVNDWQAIADEIAMAQPDLILFGLTLPSFDGFYWIQEVRKTCQAPIIVISAADIDSNVMHAVAAGADDYLMKPFSLTVLLAKIQAQLRRHTTDQRESQVHWGNNQLNPLTGQLRSPQGTVQLPPPHRKCPLAGAGSPPWSNRNQGAAFRVALARWQVPEREHVKR